MNNTKKISVTNLRIGLCSLMVMVCLLIPKAVVAQDANELFTTFSPALVQIKSINLESGQKSSIGTGFFISASGDLVTNYHVISSYVQSPEQYKLEYVDDQERTSSVSVVAVDVINDLALLSSNANSDVFFKLSEQEPEKGSDLFALGNPHDLGMIVVPGTYNGVQLKSFYQRIHFTGSINPGMSGGPTVNQAGNVVGINVATAGNQIGFLVPVERLWLLIKKQKKLDNLVDQDESGVVETAPDLIADIRDQLIENQTDLYQELLKGEWPSSTLGGATVPKEMSKFMPCWGDSNQDQEKKQYNQATSNCRLDESIYISDSLRTGFAQIGFNWIESDKLNNMQLSHLYTLNLNSRYGRNNAGSDDVTDFHCNESIMNNAVGDVVKGMTCIRAYRKYEGLFDVRFHSLLLEKDNQTLIGKYFLQGVTQQTAHAFYAKFMENVQWN
ncbi:serine protease [uncultured Psychrosphaera sp.]|uniref:S1 family peptidase n=1 Tax=uncultured Psychrosphaera sp. TaxID=1403522 RepID=UPI0030FB90F5